MNQIIFSKFNQEIKIEQDKRKKRLLIVYKYQFILSILIILFCFIYYIYNLNIQKQKETVSKQLLSNYNINMLYSDIKDYSTINKNTDLKEPFVIGLIEIKKINIVYPILSETSDDLLRIATCRFYGPMPNEVRQSMYCRTQLS